MTENSTTPERKVAQPTEEEKLIHHARWFIQMRWVAVVAVATLVLVSVKITDLLPSVVWWPLLITTASLAGFNVLFMILVRRKRLIRLLLQLQLYADLGLLTVLLHFSGGIENPLSMIALFHVIIGAIILPKHQAYMAASVASLLFALLAWMEWAGVVEHYTLRIFPHGEEEELHASLETLYVAGLIVLRVVVYFLIAYFVTTLAERARRDEWQLEAMAKRAQAEQQLLEHSLATTGTGICVVDRDLQSHWMNDRWKSWFLSGRVDPWWQREGGTKENPAEMTFKNGLLNVTEVLLPLEERDREVSPSSTGEQRILQLTSAPLREKDGNFFQVVMLAQDITDQKKAQEQILRSGKMAAVGELAGHVAHEVNNPIAIISGKARLLLSNYRNDMSEKIAGEIGKIVDLTDRVASIAQGLLSYCRPSLAARFPLDIRIPVRKALGMVEQRAKTAGVQIVERLEDTVLVAPANALEMEQVFLNLLLNALDAMPNGGCLTISASREKAHSVGDKWWAAVVVEDTGAGMPREIRERIFEPFFTTKEEMKGTGLGLSICLGVVQSHGGEIEVESKPGRGTRFTIRLPVKDLNASKEA